MDEIQIPIGSKTLLGLLSIPKQAKGIVIFAHGSGSSRLSPRNQTVARYLEKKGLATLLFDLLTEEEEKEADYRFEVVFLASRLTMVTKWVMQMHKMPIGYFGASTGAAAALISAAEFGFQIAAVVSRGGRPDLAMSFLSGIKSPTLLIVGSKDEEVLELNRLAHSRLRCEKQLEIVEGATHLFEEAGALEEVEKLSALWFSRHFHETLRPT